MNYPTCSEPGCNKPYRCKDRCATHYQAWRRAGNATKIQLWPDRLTSNIQKSEDPDGCWTWDGLTSSAGYGVVTWPSEGAMGAHRAAYRHFIGEIPPEMHLDHLCHTLDTSCVGLGDKCAHRKCVRPDHLEIVSATENSARAHRSGRRILSIGVCRSGLHQILSDEDVVVIGKSMTCRECRRLSR